MISFRDIRAGQTVTRSFGHGITIDMVVTKVTDDEIIVGHLWTFDRDTGHEIDEAFDFVVSRLIHPVAKRVNPGKVIKLEAYKKLSSWKPTKNN